MSGDGVSSRGALAPLATPLFRAFWVANLGSMLGTWVHQVGAAWLMTSLTSSRLKVALVQAALTFPMFLLALPAGALADVLDRRRLLIAAQAWMMLWAAVLGVLTLLERVDPELVLLLIALMGLGSAIHAPTWQSSIPELVRREDLPAAVALGSVGFNLARSVGPALGGILVGLVGPGAAFLVNATSYLGVLLVALSWRRQVVPSALPAERMSAAIAGGLRYVRHEPRLRAVIARGALFVVCASGLWALLPVLAREDLGLSATHYGLLVGSMGAGAVLGAFLLARVRGALTLEQVVVIATLVMAAVVLGVARVRRFELLCPLLLPGGAAWLWLLSSLNTAVQGSVPGWIRGRAISVYLLAFFGAHAGGSALWGWVASRVGTADALDGVALGLAGGVLLAPLLRLPSGELLDLSPSQHWPAPRMAEALEPGEGPVLVTIEYEVDPARAPELLRGLEELRRLRLRDGATAWGAYQDAADPGRWSEQFLVPSWEAHLRQHERVTVADRAVQERVEALHKGPEPPRVRHLLARRAPL
mgnify:CR=1 FL=1